MYRNSLLRNGVVSVFQRNSCNPSHVASALRFHEASISQINLFLGRRSLSTKSLEGFKFRKTHEYIKVDGNIGTIGVSDFAQSQLGDIVYVELPNVSCHFPSLVHKTALIEHL